MGRRVHRGTRAAKARRPTGEVRRCSEALGGSRRGTGRERQQERCGLHLRGGLRPSIDQKVFLKDVIDGGSGSN